MWVLVQGAEIGKGFPLPPAQGAWKSELNSLNNAPEPISIAGCVYDLEGVVGKIFLHRFPIVQPGAVVSGGRAGVLPKGI